MLKTEIKDLALNSTMVKADILKRKRKIKFINKQRRLYNFFY